MQLELKAPRKVFYPPHVYTLVLATSQEDGGQKVSHVSNCLEAEAVPAIVDVLCEETKKICQEHYGQGLRSLVITGSIARGEGSFGREDGTWQPLSDAEFVVALADSTTLPSPGEERGVRARITDALSARGVNCSLSLSFVHGDFYRKLRPSMFAFELRHWGRCIAGDPDILSIIPQFSAADIPLEDAWRTLCNRLLEQIESIADLEPGVAVVPSRLLYRTVKLYLDMASSFLLFLGLYEPSYRARADRLRGLQQSVLEPSPFDVSQFAGAVERCTEWKLRPDPKSDLGSWWDLLLSSQRYALGLLEWELSRLTNNVAVQPETRRVWMRSQPLSERVRGWAYVVRKSGWFHSWRQWPRWIRCAAQGSPRRLIYTAAAEIYRLLPGLLSGEIDDLRAADSLKKIEDLLPVVNVYGPADSRKWRQVARSCCWNYHRFLENTRS